MDKENYVTINDEGLAEVSPTASRDAQLAFIDNFRQLQGENTAQIGTQTHALGSDLTAPYGGLHGPSEYMRSRYQTPQTESRVAAMRTAAQLSALNQLMQNDQNRWNKRYNKAYSDYQRRKANSGGGGGNGGNIIGQAYDEFGSQNTLGVANDDYDKSLAPYGTQVMPTGGYDSEGNPFFQEVALDANGNPTKTVVKEYTHETIGTRHPASDQTANIVTGAGNVVNAGAQVASALTNPLVAGATWIGQGLRNVFGWN